MLVETPTVDHLLPVLSVVSICTLMMASVPRSGVIRACFVIGQSDISQLIVFFGSGFFQSPVEGVDRAVAVFCFLYFFVVDADIDCGCR